MEPSRAPLIAGHLDPTSPDRPLDRPNAQRLLFLAPHTRELYPDRDEELRRAVSSLRVAAGQYPDDQQLAELIGELPMKSVEFSGLWSRHGVSNCTFGTKRFHHPLMGGMELDFEMMQTPDGSGQGVLMFTAADGSPSEAALRLLGAERGPAARVLEPERP